jgi:hypothetical protein
MSALSYNKLSDEEFLEFCNKAVIEGKAATTKDKNRKYLVIEGFKAIPTEKALYFFWHPEQVHLRYNFIKFRDGDRNNLSYENIKITSTQNEKLIKSLHGEARLDTIIDSLDEYDREYYYASIEALECGHQYKTKGRIYLRHKGRTFPKARAIWNLNHPDDPVRMNELIQHKDGNLYNDENDNLMKQSTNEYMKLCKLKEKSRKKKAK